MTGKVSARSAVITITDQTTARTVSGTCLSYAFNADVNKIDVTGFGDGSMNYIPGMPVYDLSTDFLWDTTASTGITVVGLLDFLGSTAVTITLKPETSGKTMTGTFIMENFPVTGKPDGALTLGTIKWSVTGSSAPTWA